MSDFTYESKDGDTITNDAGYPVGYCTECRKVIIKAYMFRKLMYCIDCFPKVVSVQKAIDFLQKSKTTVNCIVCGTIWFKEDSDLCPKCRQSR